MQSPRKLSLRLCATVAFVMSIVLVVLSVEAFNARRAALEDAAEQKLRTIAMSLGANHDFETLRSRRVQHLPACRLQ